MAAGNTSEVRNSQRAILDPSMALMKPLMLNKAMQCLTLNFNYNSTLCISVKNHLTKIIIPGIRRL